MTDILNKIDSINASIDGLQKEVDFFLVLHFLEKVQIFQKDFVGKFIDNTEMKLLRDHRDKLSLAFDDDCEDIGLTFSQLSRRGDYDLELKKGWDNVYKYLNFDDGEITIEHLFDIEEFINHHATDDYKKQFFSYRLNNNLENKQPFKKKKI